MKSLVRRVEALERAAAGDIPLSVKAWLSWELSDAEKIALDDEPVIEPGWDAVDTSDWSADVCEWLGVER